MANVRQRPFRCIGPKRNLGDDAVRVVGQNASIAGLVDHHSRSVTQGQDGKKGSGRWTPADQALECTTENVDDVFITEERIIDGVARRGQSSRWWRRSEEHTSELQSQSN